MSNSKTKNRIQLVKIQFLCGVPIKKIDWNDIFTTLTLGEQETLINETVDNELVIKFPLKITYQREFVKFIISALDKHGDSKQFPAHSVTTEISDSVYDALGRLVALPDSSGQFFKHYEWESGKVISLKEEANFISSGTTGLCTWTASIALADWCLTFANLFKNKTVLELGSGIGLTGLIVAKECNPQKVYLTDCHDAVLDRLKQNVELNLESIENLNCTEIIESNEIFNSTENFNSTKKLDSTENFNSTENSSRTKNSKTPSKIEVLNLPWEKVTKGVAENLAPDILLAADVVYDPDLFESLATAIQHFLVNKNKNTCKAILACTERNQETLHSFLLVIDNKGLNCQEIPFHTPKHLVWDKDTPVRLFQLEYINLQRWNGWFSQI